MMVMLFTHAIFVVDYVGLLSVQASTCCQAISLSRFRAPRSIE